MQRPRSSAGYTIVEVLVAASIGFVLLSGATTALTTGLGHQAVWQGQAALQASAQVALGRLADELAETVPSAVRYDSAPPGVVFISPRDALSAVSFDLSGELLWQGYVGCYLETVAGRSCLVRKVSALASPVVGPPALPATVTTAWLQAQPGQAHLLGSDVTHFTVTGSNPLTLTLTARQISARPQQLALATRVLLRAGAP